MVSEPLTPRVSCHLPIQGESEFGLLVLAESRWANPFIAGQSSRTMG